MKRLLLVPLILILVILIVSGCWINLSEKVQGERTKDTGDELLGIIDQDKNTQDKGDDIPINEPSGAYSVPFVDGLHVTGNPIEINIKEYRLEVTGEVKNPLSLTFKQVKEMEPTKLYAELECPGFFIDEGYWTGVEIRELLELAEVKDGANKVQFIAYDGGYKKSLPLDTVLSADGLLVAYHFEDKEFSDVHGYPLRIVAKGEIGSVWVKWLGKIEVLSEPDND
jgi:DMSO/TMAO reductase YedYZ molybdopterin-dependent catalytic subunit